MSIAVAALQHFNLETTDSHIKSTQDLRGSWFVLYFYPKDNTSGCTLQAKEFSDHYARFKKKKITILGVSRDSLLSHKRFSDKIAIPFPLVSDSKEELCRYFDVMREKSMYGRKYMGIERSTFIINPAQEIVAEMRKVKTQGHAQAVFDLCMEYIA